MWSGAKSAALGVSLCLSASGASATLMDGSYSIDFVSAVSDGTDFTTTAVFSGSFDVTLGLIENLEVMSSPVGETGADQVYTGVGVNELGGSMFSANLTSSDANGGLLGFGRFTFNDDGTYICDAVNNENPSNLLNLGCLFGSRDGNTFLAADPVTGTYRIIDETAVIPLPATLPLVLIGLGALGALRRRERV